jgi:hypothetical protein
MKIDSSVWSFMAAPPLQATRMKFSVTLPRRPGSEV